MDVLAHKETTMADGDEFSIECLNRFSTHVMQEDKLS